MKLSISNIAWSAKHDEEMYAYLKETGFKGLEIAPTRIYPENPYNKLSEAKDWAARLKEVYSLDISSMQSIWFGRDEKLFGTIEERNILIEYTKKAILFAEAVGCSNLVFGCPKNRDVEDVSANYSVAIDFFRELGNFALDHNTVIGLEPNPKIYNTRFINTTEQAFELVSNVQSNGFLVNVDLGAILQNNEEVDIISGNIDLVNHVHISEPYLTVVEQSSLHIILKELLNKYKYNNFVSIEMKNQELSTIKSTVNYVKKVFG
jgi:sugar phosphate isomerase/epimerase